jgi:hypothetical protein
MDLTFVRGAALFFVPMVVASCGGSSDQGLIKNSPDAELTGCTTTPESCNEDTVSGVVAKVILDDTGEAVIRFVTITDNGDDTLTYDDGLRTIVFDINGDGPNGEILAGFPVGDYTLNVVMDQDFGVFEDGIVGVHTDADSVPLGGTATYLGEAYIAYGENAIQTITDDFGDSTLEVNFGTALADLTIDIDDFEPNITDFDQIVSEGMVIDGYSFTGDEVVLLLDSADVTGTVLGGNLEGASAGMFFGPVNGDLNPEEFGAVTVINGDDGFVYGLAAGAALPNP